MIKLLSLSNLTVAVTGSLRAQGLAHIIRSFGGRISHQLSELKCRSLQLSKENGSL